MTIYSGTLRDYFLSIAYLVEVVLKMFMRSKSFCGRRFTSFQHDLAITGPQELDIVLPLVLLDSSKEPFTVAGQGLIYVDLVTSRDGFAYFSL